MVAKAEIAGSRVFVAIDLPLPVTGELAAWFRLAQAGQGMRRVSPENMHLTLAFLGRQPENEQMAIAAYLGEVAAQAPRLETGPPLWLPSRRPRALAVEIRSEQMELQELHNAVAESLVNAIDWQPARSFRPHVTVARLGRQAEPARGPLPPTPALSFKPASFSLYRSHLHPEGAEYEVLQTWPLREGD